MAFRRLFGFFLSSSPGILLAPFGEVFLLSVDSEIAWFLSVGCRASVSVPFYLSGPADFERKVMFGPGSGAVRE